jgi:hypothetical protein
MMFSNLNGSAGGLELAPFTPSAATTMPDLPVDCYIALTDNLKFHTVLQVDISWGLLPLQSQPHDHLRQTTRVLQVKGFIILGLRSTTTVLQMPYKGRQD